MVIFEVHERSHDQACIRVPACIIISARSPVYAKKLVQERLSRALHHHYSAEKYYKMIRLKLAFGTTIFIKFSIAS